ncbi:MAG: hypothetical protein J7L64_04910 [Acidobacteria bacterium]|nr:hypothetical protein [Acidobacteriota bacterium]
MKKSLFEKTVILLIGIALFSGLQLKLDELKLKTVPKEPIYLPSGKYLKAIALGNNTVMADLLYLWSIQHYSIYTIKEHRFRYLEHVYNMITDLDPHYLDPYLIGALIMAKEGGFYQMAFRLLEKGMKNNPDAWILPVDAGFYAFQDLKDYELALYYFKKAAEIKGSPPFIKRLIAGIYERKNENQTALAFWTEIYRTAKEDWVKTIAYNHIYDLKIKIDLEQLRVAIELFKDQKKRLPRSLRELIKAGFLYQLPKDPEGNNYLYNPRTGEVKSRTPFRLKR